MIFWLKLCAFRGDSFIFTYADGDDSAPDSTVLYMHIYVIIFLVECQQDTRFCEGAIFRRSEEDNDRDDPISNRRKTGRRKVSSLSHFILFIRDFFFRLIKPIDERGFGFAEGCAAGIDEGIAPDDSFLRAAFLNKRTVLQFSVCHG